MRCLCEYDHDSRTSEVLSTHTAARFSAPRMVDGAGDDMQKKNDAELIPSVGRNLRRMLQAQVGPTKIATRPFRPSSGLGFRAWGLGAYGFRV